MGDLGMRLPCWRWACGLCEDLHLVVPSVPETASRATLFIYKGSWGTPGSLCVCVCVCPFSIHVQQRVWL